MGFSTAFKYAWHGSGRRWDAAPIGVVGGLVGGLVIYLLGLKLPQTILDNPLWGGVFAVAIGAIIGVALIFLMRLCWWPFHRRLEPHGGLHSFLRAKLGDFMWPIVLTASGLLAFVLLTGIGTIWLSLQALKSEPNRQMETPNTVGKPDFELFAPNGRYRLTWPSDRYVSFYLRLDTEKNPEFSNNPAFIIRNRTNTVAYRVIATWKSETSMDMQEEIKKSKLSRIAEFKLSDTAIDIIAKPAAGSRANYRYYLSDAPSSTISVVAKEEEIYFPVQLQPLAAIYFASRIPDEIGETSPPFVARLTLDWETSEGKQQRAYRVKITATNAKGSSAEFPMIDAYLNFSVTEIAH